MGRLSLVLILLFVALPGCKSRSSPSRIGPPEPPEGVVCRPLAPDEEVIVEVGTCFVVRDHTKLFELRSDTVMEGRWRVLSIVGKKVMARYEASTGNFTSNSAPVEILFSRTLIGKGEPEIVSVPAGQFRCKKMTSTSGDTVVESWSAKGLPSAVHVRQNIRSSKFVKTSELVRIENARIAPPPPPEAPPPAFTRVEPDDEVIPGLGTCFVSEMKMKTAVMDMTMATRVTVVELDGKKAVLKTVTTSGDSVTETSHEMPLAAPALEEPLETIEVPAGRFRCKKSTSKSTNQAGTFTTEIWMARGIPSVIRMTTSGPDMTNVQELIRIENAKIQKPVAPQGAIHVLVVGVNEYADAGVPALRLAEADARGVAAIFGAPKGQVRLLLGKEATRASILKGVREHLGGTAVREEDVVILYFAGHALADGTDAYLLGSDAQLDALPETAVSTAGLWTYWSQLRARRKLLITDACRTDGLKGLKGAGTVGFAKEWANTHVVASTGAGQGSVEEEGAVLGVFAATLLAGLGGEADEGRDGRVSGDELSKFLVREVAVRSKGKQTPAVRAGDVPILLTR